MIEENTVIDEITITRDGHVLIRYALLVLKDGVEISRRNHRTAVEVGASLDKLLSDVDANLRLNGCKPLSDADGISLLRSVTQLAHAAERVTAYRARRAASEELKTTSRK